MTYTLMRSLVCRVSRINAGYCAQARHFAEAAAGQNEVYVEKLTGDRDGVAYLTMNRPQGKNSFSKNFLSQFEQCLQSLMVERTLRVLIVRSLVPGVFCAGADLKER